MRVNWAFGENGLSFQGPKEFIVKAKTKGNYVVTFKPEWIFQANAKLSIENPLTREVFAYQLRGKSEEPKFENILKIDCKVGDKKSFNIPVRNYSLEKIRNYRA